MPLLFSFLVACGAAEVQTEVEPEVVDIAGETGGDPYGKTWTPHPEMPTIDESGAITTESGLTIISITDGEGDSPTPGQAVSMHYHGWLAADGSAFDSSSKRGETLDFNVGTGGVIRGWDEGILALKPGQKARLRIPSNLGYGARGAPPVIPPGADLIFDVWLVSVD
jgi:peptidylprolyl isomerase